MPLKLHFLKKLDICHGPEGLTEPSGLTLSKDGKAFWTVSDDTRTVFKLDLDGNLIPGRSFSVGNSGLEGIALDQTGDFLYAVQEEGNALRKYSLATKNPVLSNRLCHLGGYRSVEKYLSRGDENKGLEGITVDTDTGHLFLLKEADPGLILQVTPDLQTLIEYRKLTKDRGFTDKDIKQKKIDYSGISYDSKRRAFWIVSDQAKRIYLYSWKEDEVLFDKSLKYTENQEKKTVSKAEGVAYEAASQRLYIVCDEEARLYVYEVSSS